MFSFSLGAQTVAAEKYVWRNVAIGGGGFVTGIIMHPRQKDLFYARTDVGGAYRWDSATSKWIPLLDWLGADDNNLMGIESIALDPTDARVVYIAAGTYSRTNAAILRSDDHGKTFERTEVPFRMGGNELGRFNGERLAVDPNDGQILFFGSRRDGLWKSADRGASWENVNSFPAIDTTEPLSLMRSNAWSRGRFDFTPQSVGIVFVQFDAKSDSPGKPTPTIYVGVSTVQTNFYCSHDGGATWQAVANQPIGLRPNHLAAATDGIFYLTYGKEPGPNAMTDGAVWKFNPTNNSWTDITPLKSPDGGQVFGYGAVAVDAQDAATITVATFARWKPHDEIFRSTDGGVHWTQLLQNAKWDFSTAPYTATHTPHWVGDIEINPLNRDQLLFTTGYGIWCCTNVTAADHGLPTHWCFFDNGLEETVPLALISPSEGAHLLSGLGDLDGFRHDDLDVSPLEGTFSGPRFSNTEDLAFAGQHPEIMVRVGSADKGVRAVISSDGGKKWTALAGEPPNSGGSGTVTISADGKSIVWTPRRSTAYVTTDLGANWTECMGLSTGVRVVADTVNPTRFYACDFRTGKLMASKDGAAHFVATEASFQPATGIFPGRGVPMLYATPGAEGDLWLAVRNEGLLHSTNGGRTFVRLPAVQEADSLGLGKAAPGKDSPALFLAGTIEGLHAVYRSDDDGGAWVRINDDQHQFGSVSRVTGDPRIYGRVYFATGGRGIIYGDAAGKVEK